MLILSLPVVIEPTEASAGPVMRTSGFFMSGLLAISQLEMEIHTPEEPNTVLEPNDWLQMVAKY